MRKGQTSFEFVVLVSFVMLIFTVTYVVVQSRTLSLIDDQTHSQAKALSNIVSSEIELAYKVHQGYKKSFWIPQYINGEEYTIELIDSAEIEIIYKGQTHLKFLGINQTNITGNISKGYNTITKNTSRIHIEPGMN